MEELFAQHHAALLRFFVRLCGCRATADDLLQSTFLKLWKYRRNYQGTGNGRTYVYQVALNQWREFGTRAGRARRLLERWLRVSSDHRCVTAPEDAPAIDRAEDRQRVWRAIDKLPSAQRIVFVLHRIEELSCREIADITTESVKTVESRLRLALMKVTGDLRRPEGRS
ncbi:MAG: RNA polymerase sigma factor [Planctomycetota bacterium]